MSIKKRLILGDIHGHWDSLKSIYDKENPDEVIILGDYFDNFSNNVDVITECFNNIIKLQEDHLNKNKGDFILLLGNHDFHYIFSGEHYSGYNWRYATFAETLINKLLSSKKMKICHVDYVNKTIYSHAGISNVWVKNSKLDGVDLNFINEVNIYNLAHLSMDPYGNSIIEGPLWIRPNSLINCMYKDEDGFEWTQIVGHTHMYTPCVVNRDNIVLKNIQDIESYPHHKTDYDFNKLYVMDVMPNYYIVETYDFETEKLVTREIIQNN